MTPRDAQQWDPLATSLAPPPPQDVPSDDSAAWSGVGPASTSRRRSAIECAEPVFALLCQLNRAGRSQMSPPEELVRSQLEKAIATSVERFAQSLASADESTVERFRRPLVFFVDFSVRHSALQCAFDWNNRPLAQSLVGESSGDKAFFDELQRELQANDETSTQVLPLYHECMAFGFAGVYKGNLQQVGDLMSATRGELARRGVDAFEDPYGKVTPAAYAYTDDTVLPTGERNRIVGLIGVIAVGVSLT
ncbi:MAG: DotU family type IV/VI secretion system protein, partial [Planctomycetota bacterium]